MYFCTEKRRNGHRHCLSEEARYVSSLPPWRHKQKQVYKGISLVQHLPTSLNDEPEKAQGALTLHFQISFQLQDLTDLTLHFKHSLLMTISCWSRRFPLKNPSNLIPQSSLGVPRPSHLFQWALRGQSSWCTAVKARWCGEVLREQHGKRFLIDSSMQVLRTLLNCLQWEILLVP